MIRTIAVLLFLGLSFPVAANSQIDNAANICKPIATLSNAIMLSRQSGVRMADIMSLPQMKELPPELRGVQKSMTIEAFESPLYSTEAAKQSAITEFENKWYLNCTKAARSKN